MQVFTHTHARKPKTPMDNNYVSENKALVLTCAQKVTGPSVVYLTEKGTVL